MSQARDVKESVTSTSANDSVRTPEQPNGPADRTFPKGKYGDEVPTSAVPTLAAIAASIKRSAAGMGQWGMEELTLGLYKVANRHALEGAVDTIVGSQVTDRHELVELLHWLRWAMAAYEFDRAVLATNLGIKEDRVLKQVTKSALMRPAYYIAVDDSREYVVLSIRGTHAASDVLTDLNPHSECFEGGYGHSGMLNAARWLLVEEGETLRSALMENKNYRLVLTGHSLGAGTAALLAMLLHEARNDCMLTNSDTLSRLGIPVSRISCWAYACPPCVDKKLAALSSAFISTVVLQDDVVARCSPASLEELRTEILETDWSTALPEGSMQGKIVGLAQQSHSYLSKFEAAAGLPPGHLFKQAKSLGWSAICTAGQKLVQQYDAAQSGELGTVARSRAGWVTAAGVLAGAVLSVAAQQAVNSIDRAEQTSPFTNPQRKFSGTDGEVETNANQEVVLLTGEEVEEQRLFAPGLLYHIVRKPLEPGQEPPLSVDQLVNVEWESLEEWKEVEGEDDERRRGKKTEVEYWLDEEKNLEAEGVNTSGDGSANKEGPLGWWWGKKKLDETQDVVDGKKETREGGKDKEEKEEKKEEISGADKFMSVVWGLQSKIADLKIGGVDGGLFKGGEVGPDKGKRNGGEDFEEHKGREEFVKHEGSEDFKKGDSKEIIEKKERENMEGGKNLWAKYPKIFSLGKSENSNKVDASPNEVCLGRKGGEWSKKPNQKLKIPNENSVRHIVYKGIDPHSRFKRMVLSTTMLSDHACKPYGEGIINAMQWC